MSKSIVSERSQTEQSRKNSKSVRDLKLKKQKHEPKLWPAKNKSLILLDKSRESLLKERRGSQLKERDINKNHDDVFTELYENRKSSGMNKCQANKDTFSHRPSINSISREIVGELSFSQRM